MRVFLQRIVFFKVFSHLSFEFEVELTIVLVAVFILFRTHALYAFVRFITRGASVFVLVVTFVVLNQDVAGTFRRSNFCLKNLQLFIFWNRTHIVCLSKGTPFLMSFVIDAT